MPAGPPTARFSLVTTTRLERFEQDRLALTEFLEGSPLGTQARFVVDLAVEEIVTNIAKYSHPGGGDHSVEIALELEHDLCTLEIVDDGEPYDPRSAPKPDLDASIEERSVGGLGIHLLIELAEDLTYETGDGRNTLRLVVRDVPDAGDDT